MVQPARNDRDGCPVRTGPGQPGDGRATAGVPAASWRRSGGCIPAGTHIDDRIAGRFSTGMHRDGTWARMRGPTEAAHPQASRERARRSVDGQRAARRTGGLPAAAARTPGRVRRFESPTATRRLRTSSAPDTAPAAGSHRPASILARFASADGCNRVAVRLNRATREAAPETEGAGGRDRPHGSGMGDLETPTNCPCTTRENGRKFARQPARRSAR